MESVFATPPNLRPSIERWAAVSDVNAHSPEGTVPLTFAPAFSDIDTERWSTTSNVNMNSINATKPLEFRHITDSSVPLTTNSKFNSTFMLTSASNEWSVHIGFDGKVTYTGTMEQAAMNFWNTVCQYSQNQVVKTNQELADATSMLRQIRELVGVEDEKSVVQAVEMLVSRCVELEFNATIEKVGRQAAEKALRFVVEQQADLPAETETETLGTALSFNKMNEVRFK
jgi:hypothetical protein